MTAAISALTVAYSVGLAAALGGVDVFLSCRQLSRGLPAASLTSTVAHATLSTIFPFIF